MKQSSVSVIVPTIGRPKSLRDLLESLSAQTVKVSEVLIADGSSDDRTSVVAHDPRWKDKGLVVSHLRVSPPNAVHQREAAIRRAQGKFLLLLDDDVVLEERCVERMLGVLEENRGAVAVSANYDNQTWPGPTRPWRLYLRYVLRMKEGEWQGRVVGPLLRFGYHSPGGAPRKMQWLGAGKSLIRSAAYEAAGGFSDFFLHRCTMNEDVDLGIKLTRIGDILLCPTALLSHFHAPEGRVSISTFAEDDLYNRFLVLHRTMNRSKSYALGQVTLFHVIETVSDLYGVRDINSAGQRLRRIWGRSNGLRLLLGRFVLGRSKWAPR